MSEPHLSAWETLFRHVLRIIDSAGKSGFPMDDWSFGGGTVLMRKYRHRISKDIDIFVPDPQFLGFLTPRLNDAAEEDILGYVEQSGFVKLYYPEGEVDFVAAAPLTENPWAPEWVLDRRVRVETPAEIVAKKVKFRASDFKARDIFDFALVIEREPDSICAVLPMLTKQRSALLERFTHHDSALREDFAAIDALEYRPAYDECVARIRSLLGSTAADYAE